MNPVAETAALLTLLLNATVRDKRAVKVTTISGQDGSIVFVFEAGPKDRGKVLGRHGKMAQSLRFILLSIGKENGRSFLLDIPKKQLLSFPGATIRKIECFAHLLPKCCISAALSSPPG